MIALEIAVRTHKILELRDINRTLHCKNTLTGEARGAGHDHRPALSHRMPQRPPAPELRTGRRLGLLGSFRVFGPGHGASGNSLLAARGVPVVSRVRSCVRGTSRSSSGGAARLARGLGVRGHDLRGAVELGWE